MKEILISASFHADVILKSDIASLRRKLNELKILKIISSNPLKYEVETPGTGLNSILELSESHINLRFFFKKPDAATYRDNLVSFISLIAFLDGFYDIKLRNIYGYVTEALNQSWHNVVKDNEQVAEGLKEQIRALNESNCALSSQVVRLSQERYTLSKRLDVCREFASIVIERASQNGMLKQLAADIDIKGIEEALA